MSAKYKAKPGSTLTDKQAQVVGRVIEELEARDGVCTPAALVEAARPTKSPIHKLVFNCDERTAAARYWLERAGHLIRSVVINVKVQPHAPQVPTRVFIHVRPTASGGDDGNGNGHATPGGYKRYDRVLADTSLGGGRDQALATALSELRSFAAKYRVLTQLAGVISVIDKALVDLGALVDKIEPDYDEPRA